MIDEVKSKITLHQRREINLTIVNGIEWQRRREAMNKWGRGADSRTGGIVLISDRRIDDIT